MKNYNQSIFAGVLVLCLWGMGVNAEILGPGWFNLQSELVVPQLPLSAPLANAGESYSFVSGVADVETAEIAELARGLQHDPELIYQYVHNHIRYVPYYGALKGATRTLLDRSGNDLDQAALTVALLRASDVTARYVSGTLRLPVSRSNKYDALHYLGVNIDWLPLAILFNSGGLAPSEYNFSYIKIPRVWVRAEIDGSSVDMDPAYKRCERVAGIDLSSAMGYSRTGLLSIADGTVNLSEDSVKDIDEEALRQQMSDYAEQLTGVLKTNYPNRSVEEIAGGVSIVSEEGPAGINLTRFTYAEVENWEDIPSSLFHTVTITHGTVNKQFYIPEIADKKVSIRYSGTRVLTLSLDDSPVLQEQLPSGTDSLRLSINHPYPQNGGTYCDQEHVYNVEVNNDNSYVILSEFGASGDGKFLEARQHYLEELRDQGYIENSPELRSESLHILGQTWMRETTLADDLLSQLTDTYQITHHRFGLMAQESGYYIDVANQAVSNFERVSGAGTFSFFCGGSLMDSAMEHGTLEQLQGTNRPSISTVKLLTLSSRRGDRIFRTDVTNYNSDVRSELDNYSSGELNYFSSRVGEGYTLILPEDKNMTPATWDWQGYGRIEILPSRIAMVIDGELNGGYSVYTGETDSATINQNYVAETAWTIDANNSLSDEPVDMATGAYLSMHTDLTLSGPKGLRFARQYSSRNRNRNRNLGYGWVHSYDMYVSEHSDYASMLGSRTPADTAALLANFTVVSDLLKNENSAEGWAVSALSTQWAMDQLTQNAVSITRGGKGLSFIRQPDGSFTPPPGETSELTQSNGLYRLTERFGTEYTFNAENKIDSITDIDGNTLTFTYNAQSNLQTVANSFGQSMTLSYTDGLITSVSDNTGRSVGYEYDSSDNLINFEDAAGFDWGIEYDNGHRILSLTDPEEIQTIENHYNSLGQVTNQISATGHPWNFYFTDFRNIEENPYGNQTIYHYNKKGQEIGVENAFGDRVHKQYDGQRHLIHTVDLRDVHDYFMYDGNHNLITKYEAVATPEMRISHYRYDATNQLICVSNQINGTEWNVSSFEYDAKHHLTKRTDALGNETDFEYFSNGLLKKKAEDGGRTTDFSYDSFGTPNTIISTDAGTIDLDYNARGELVDRKDAKNQRTEYLYDNNGKPISVLYPDGSSVSNTYWDNGLLKETTDGKGQTVSKVWNNAYKLQSVTYPDGGIVSNTYDAADRLIGTTDQHNNPTTYQLDSIGRATSVSSVYSVVENSYDPVGNITNSSIDPSGLNLWTATEYDTLNRPTSVQSAESVDQFSYDLLGRATNRIDAASKHWKTEHDALSRPIKSIRPTGAEEQFSYDPLGNRTGFINAENKAIGFGFDAQSRVTTITNAIGKVTQFQFDPNGNMTNRLDAMNRSTAYSFDGMNRIDRIEYPDTTEATFDYDLNGNLVEQTFQSTQTQFSYDEMNRLASSLISVNSRSFAVTNSYDLSGNRTNIVYPGGLVVSYEYDEENRIKNVSTDYADDTEQFSFNYDGASRLTNIIYPNGVSGDYEYDAESRIVGFSYNNGSNFVERVIQRDPRGYKTTEDIFQGLESAFIEGEQRHEHNAADQLMHIDQRDTWLGSQLEQWYNRDYSYNENGCLIEEDVNRPTWNTNSTIHEYTTGYTYDFDNRLKSVVGGLPYKNVEYLYDVSGVRVARIDGGTTNYFVIDYNAPLKMPLAETDAQGNITRYYIWSSHGLLAHMDVNPSTGTITQTRYYHSDEQSSTLALTDETGVVTDEFAYTPYGVSTHTGTSDTPYAWLGGIAVRAEGDGLYYMLNRYYSAPMRRFISTDPSGIDGGANLYAYANLAPTHFADPLGLWGVQFGENGVNIGNGHPTLLFTQDSWSDAGHGAAAFVDGVVPFIDPLASSGVYDASDPALQISQAVGSVTREVLTVIGGGGIGTYARASGQSLTAAQRVLVGEFGPSTVGLLAGDLTTKGLAAGYAIKTAGRVDLFMNVRELVTQEGEQNGCAK